VFALTRRAGHVANAESLFGYLVLFLLLAIYYLSQTPDGRVDVSANR